MFSINVSHSKQKPFMVTLWSETSNYDLYSYRKINGWVSSIIEFIIWPLYGIEFNQFQWNLRQSEIERIVSIEIKSAMNTLAIIINLIVLWNSMQWNGGQKQTLITSQIYKFYEKLHGLNHIRERMCWIFHIKLAQQSFHKPSRLPKRQTQTWMARLTLSSG